MQTSLAVREVVMKLLDVLVFVSVYFFGAVVLAAIERLAAGDAVPRLARLLRRDPLRTTSRKLGKVGEEQADARSSMTGRIVDSYTNIATVKLFSPLEPRGELRPARRWIEFLEHRPPPDADVLDPQLRALRAQRRRCSARSARVGIWLWLQGSVTGGALAVSAALVMRFQGMSQWIMWEMTQLFENIGTVRDGISSISLPRVVTDAPGAKAHRRRPRATSASRTSASTTASSAA